MIIARAEVNGKIKYFQLINDEYYTVEGDIYGDFKVSDKPTKIDKLLCPVEPTKILALGVNYLSHMEEMKHDKPVCPIMFMKPLTSMLEPNGKIIYPAAASVLHYEAELAVVIGKTCHKVKKEKAKEYIFGYTCANDISERNFQKQDGQWTRAKGYDTFCPLGSYVVTDIDASNVQVEAVLNGNVVQSGNTKDLINDIPAIIEWVSEVMTLNQGDVILTGTPRGVGEIHPGDTIEIKIEKVGSIKNTVAAE
ncbi:MAG TPA: fumarylacetoacetate hydrolase family protein [Eubacteriales bacterium]|nr:fumarylacetoacetate hydrolase family protein [Eubacteriales bacterium]